MKAGSGWIARTKGLASAALFVVALGFCSSASTQPDPPAAAPNPVWSSNTRILSVIALESYDIVRIETDTSALVNPAGCVSGPSFVDVQLDTGGRSAEEQRQILNAINMAFMTGRNVRLLIRDDMCSTAATSSNLRVAVGVRVFN